MITKKNKRERERDVILFISCVLVIFEGGRKKDYLVMSTCLYKNRHRDWMMFSLPGNPGVCVFFSYPPGKIKLCRFLFFFLFSRGTCRLMAV